MGGSCGAAHLWVMADGGRQLGDILLAGGALAKSALDAALEEQTRSGRRLADVLLRRGLVDEAQLSKALAQQLGLEHADPPFRPSREALARIEPRLARAKGVLPLSVEGRRLRALFADPLDAEAVEEVRFRSGCHVEALVAQPSAVLQAVEDAYGGELPELLNRLARAPAPAGPGGGERQVLEREASAAPIVRIVDHLLAEAMDARASDIHIERMGAGSRVRFRIDGLLASAAELPPGTHRAAISRVKIMAGLDISVRRRAQDGGFSVRRQNAEITVRASTIPTHEGEKAVLRLLDPGDAPRDLGSLGLALPDLQRLRGILARGQGVLLAAGPTGSGKTTTLSGAVAELASEQVNVVTLEDPIEYRFPGLAQVQIDRKAGVTFPSGLRALLRQDPDVILVGEIRDRETAEIAMSAAVTGHLVLTTVHTIDAPSAVVRLLEMGVPPFLLAGGLAGVVAQRLVRRVCSHCRRRAAAACQVCRDGYRGRSGVFEVLVVDDEIRTAVAGGASVTALRALARRNGMVSMARDARRQIAEGVTTPHEVGRIIALSETAGVACTVCGEALPSGATGCPFCGHPRAVACPCGEPLESRWRFCPACLRPTAGAAP